MSEGLGIRSEGSTVHCSRVVQVTGEGLRVRVRVKG